jgi:MFS family permease
VISIAIGFTVYVFYQPYFKAIGIPLVYFGWLYLAMNLLGATGSKVAHVLENKLGEKKILMLLLAVVILCYFGISKEIMIIGAIFPVILFFNGGIFEPVIADYINKHTESHHRATVLSLHTLLIYLVSTILSPFFGWIVDFWSLSTAFLTAMIIMVINLLILIIGYNIVRRK